MLILSAYAALLALAAADDEIYYHTCSTQVSSGAKTFVYISEPFAYPYDTDKQLKGAFQRHLQSLGIDAPYANCSWSRTPEKAAKSLAYATSFAERNGGIPQVVRWIPEGGSRAEIARETEKAVAEATDTAKSSAEADSGSMSPPVRTAEEREAEWQAKLAKYEAEKAAWAAKIEAQKREEARKQAQHKAAQEAAERKMRSFERVMVEHEQRQRAYEASEARHRQCVGGDQQACADIKAGKPPIPEMQLELADAGEASTDTDPNRCVTTAEIQLNATFKGNTSASVMNGCGQRVDVQICLKRGNDWNCGVDLGVDPQEKAVHSSFNATGEVFVDARLTASPRKFADPPS